MSCQPPSKPILRHRTRLRPSMALSPAREELIAHIEEYSLAMDREDLISAVNTSGRRGESHHPEIRLIDAYWSDHCRHTTFLTEIEKVSLRTNISRTFKEYLAHRSRSMPASAVPSPNGPCHLARSI